MSNAPEHPSMTVACHVGAHRTCPNQLECECPCHPPIYTADQLTSAVAEAKEKTWIAALLLLDTAPLCHCDGKQYVDPVPLVQRMNATLEAARTAEQERERER